MRHLRRLSEVEAAHWDALFPDDYPFCRHDWLEALERHGCASPRSGWEPCHLVAECSDGKLLGAAPLYAKQHSYGEFVFDFAWADASHRIGKHYYPKLVNAVPFVPSPGPRLAAASSQLRSQLAAALFERPEQWGLSSLHALFVNEIDASAFREHPFLERRDVQFHWHDRDFENFDGFLACLSSAKRKKLRRERRRIEEAGIAFEVVPGRDLSDAQWDRVYALYANTYHERGSTPYYSREFLCDIAKKPQLDLRFILALHDGRIVAMAMLLIGGQTLYGRHWGAEAHYHSLHFECCYYQGIELCLREGLRQFDAGTQGAHKLGRGFEPTTTISFHHLSDPRLRQAVNSYLERERDAIAARQSELMHHTAFRKEHSEQS